MLSMLYFLFIAPLESLMAVVLDVSYAVLDSHGWAVVALSLVVNTALLPIYAVAEGWQEDERRLRRKMIPKEQEIRFIYTGRERYALLRTLQRQSGYTQLLPLRSSVGFLLQVPFFFAAYHLLSHAEYLRGVPFGFLTDLGSPDRLFTIGGYDINLLPIIMTLVNLVSAFIYTKNLTIRDKIQLYGLALVFLVALYQSPAALTLYWTLNNAYSLVKNMVYARLGNESVTKETGGVGTGRFRQGCDRLWCRIGIPVWGEILLLVLAVGFAALFGVKGMGDFRIAFIGAMIVLALWAGTTSILRAVRNPDLASHWRWLLIGLGGVLIAMALFLSCNGYFFSSAELIRIFSICCAARLVPPLAGWISRRKGMRRFGGWFAGNPGGLAAGVVLMAGVTVFLFAPTMFYASDPTQFSNGFDEILPGLTGLFWVFVLGLFLAYRCAERYAQPYFALVCAFVSVLCVSYVLVFTGNYGVLNGFRLEDEQFLYGGRNYAYDAAIVLGSAAIFAVLIRKKAFAVLTTVSVLVTVSVFAVFYSEAHALLQVTETSKETETAQSRRASFPDYNDTLLSFSRTGQNVVILVLDMFTGDHIVPMLEKYPDLKKQLSGFVWYRDTLSMGNVTRFGLVGIHGGPSYSAFELNRRKDKIQQKAYDESYAVLSDFFSEREYSVGWGGIVMSRGDDVVQHCATPPDVVVTDEQTRLDYFPAWQQRTGFEAEIEQEWPFLAMNGLFRAMPYSLRRFIYQDGKWRRGDIAGLNALRTTAHVFAFFDSLAVASNADNPRNTFRYFYTDASHSGRFFSPENGMPTNDLRQFTRFRADPDFDVIGADHFFSELAALRAVIRWMEWLRAEGMYDNTRLIIVSDHGTQDSRDLFEAIGRLPSNIKGAAARRNPGGAYPLLMVKDFNASGPIRISDDLMTNSDVPELATTGIGMLPDRFRGTFDQAKTPDRVRLYASGDHNASLNLTTVDFLGFRVTGTMFKRENWHVIGENE